MSTKKHTNPTYISHVHLKGYKSIIDTEVELHPGLNVIIGPNGSGKTNFLEFLHRVTSLKFDELPKEISGQLKFHIKNDDNKHVYDFRKFLKINKITKKIEQKFKDNLLSDPLEIRKTIADDNGQGKLLKPIPILSKFDNWIINPILISFGLPNEIENLSKTINLVAQP